MRLSFSILLRMATVPSTQMQLRSIHTTRLLSSPVDHQNSLKKPFQALHDSAKVTGDTLKGTSEEIITSMKQASSSTNDIFTTLGKKMDQLTQHTQQFEKDISKLKVDFGSFKQDQKSFLIISLIVLGIVALGAHVMRQEIGKVGTILQQKPVRVDTVLDKIAQEIQRLQTQYNDSYSGSWWLAWASEGYGCQQKMKALVALEKEVLKLSEHGHRSITVSDITQETLAQLKNAYSYAPAEEENEFRLVLNESLKLNM